MKFHIRNYGCQMNVRDYAAVEARGFRELDRRTIGEWTTGLYAR